MFKKNRKKLTDCFACCGTGKIKRIVHVAHIGKFHLGKEIQENCAMCSLKFFENIQDINHSIH
jgi:hypothetical protein